MKPIFSAPVDTSVFSPSLAVFALMGWLNQENELIPRFAGRFNRKEEAEEVLSSGGDQIPAFFTWIDVSTQGRLRLEFNRVRIEAALSRVGEMAGRAFSPEEVDMAIDAAYAFIDAYFIRPWGTFYLGPKS